MNNTCQVIAMEGVRQDKKIDQPGWPSFIIGKRSRHDDFRHRNIYESYRDQLRDANPDLFERLYRSKDLARARQAVYSYLETVERRVFDIDRNLHPLEKSSIRECTGVLKSVFGPVNEKHTDMSALDYLYKISQGRELELEQDVAPGFIQEFIALFRGILGKSGVYDLASDNGAAEPAFLKKEGREAAVSRSAFLDTIGVHLQRATEKYPSGLEREIVERREKNRRRILHYFGGSETDWHDFRWQIRHVIREAKPLFDLIELTASQQIAVENAVKARLPFGITPYYLSLMDRNPDHGLDHAVRAQVIPPPDYVAMMIDHRLDRDRFFDFMGEQDTSPVDLVTRRYPGIAILKPFNTCAQICVYCQRNWEIDQVLEPNAMASKKKIKKALAWFDEHKSVGEVLITGGDPCIMTDKTIHWLLEEVAKREHIYRIRIGTRTPVVLPMRWTDRFVDILKQYHVPGRREIAIVSHFEHPYEITPEARAAVRKVKKAGIVVYNQQVFTIENSRRFETVKLRLDLRKIGVDPYYTFNMKGKEETRKYMVPIARILQEQMEECRLLPGLDRTDEPVFNLPRLGKNHLRAWQNHRVIMIMPNGSRVYEFHPWEKYLKPLPPYHYMDIPIQEYLEELAARGENPADYDSIWYYF